MVTSMCLTRLKTHLRSFCKDPLTHTWPNAAFGPHQKKGEFFQIYSQNDSISKFNYIIKILYHITIYCLHMYIYIHIYVYTYIYIYK